MLIGCGEISAIFLRGKARRLGVSRRDLRRTMTVGLTMAERKPGNQPGSKPYPGNENKIVDPDYRPRGRKYPNPSQRTRYKR